MAQQGKITKWNDAKGFGFIVPDAGGKEVFVHIKAFHNNSGRPQTGAVVNYETSADEQGRLRANNVNLQDQGSRKQHNGKFMALLASATFLTAIIVLTELKLLPRIVLWLYLGMSTLTLYLYYRDKSAAQSNEWRTPENTKHLFSLLGGWPGALFAQQLFRHKSRKLSFQLVFWLTMATNMAAVFYLLTPDGVAMLAALREFGQR